MVFDALDRRREKKVPGRQSRIIFSGEYAVIIFNRRFSMHEVQ
jgi:hypothetical protein